MNVKRQGTTIKSYFLSQIMIDKQKIDQIIEEKRLKPNQMTIEEWQSIATHLKFDFIPHSWFIIKEGYTR
jgi:hypothetical protein